MLIRNHQVLYFRGKYFRVCNPSFTSDSISGTSRSGPITVANAAPELIPYIVTATAIANSKWLLLPMIVVSMLCIVQFNCA
jgi:hypothetical protein